MATINLDVETWQDKVWRTADGRQVKLKDMDLGHLVNVINWINDNTESYGFSTKQAILKEVQYRQTILFSQGKPYPQKVGASWKIIDPVTGQGSIIPPPKEFIEAAKDNEAYQKMFERTQKLRKQRNESKT